MHGDGRDLAAVFAGGAAGALLRVLLAEGLGAQPGQWPWATLTANLAGTAALAALAAFAAIGPRARALLGPGLCAGVTTFSAFQLEILEMLDAGRPGLAGAYAAVSVAGCLTVAVVVGHVMGARRPS